MPPSNVNSPQDRKPPRKRSTRVSPTATVQVEDGDSKYVATAWGSGLGAAQDLVMPSGQLALVKRPGVEGLIKAGVLNDIDSLTGLVENTHIKKGAVQAASLLKDVEALDNVMHAVDRVVCHVIVKPEISMTPNDVTLRRDGVIYTDMIDITDKMFIFQYAVGGTADLERFREESEAALGDMDSE